MREPGKELKRYLGRKKGWCQQTADRRTNCESAQGSDNIVAAWKEAEWPLTTAPGKGTSSPSATILATQNSLHCFVQHLEDQATLCVGELHDRLSMGEGEARKDGTPQ